MRREEYMAGWVCALPIGLALAQRILDERTLATALLLEQRGTLRLWLY